MLKRYGWNDAFQQHFEPYAAQGLVPARVIVQQRGLYRVAAEVGEFSATLAGKFAHDAADGDYPVAGDWVVLSATPGDGTALIRAVLPRASKFVRREAGPGAPRPGPYVTV